MKVCVGIDLGSTTCKAVVLDPDGQIIGKGITNTRSNYEMATKIATHEALTNARFNRMCEIGGLDEAERRKLELNYHLQDYRHKHHELSQRLLKLAPRDDSAAREAVEKMTAYVEDCLTRPATQAELTDRSKFFKDFMTVFYLEAVELFLPAGRLDAEFFLGLLDKALVAVENEVYPISPESILLEEKELLNDFTHTQMEPAVQVGTGYGRQLLPFPEEQIRSEILCHARGAYYFFPNTRTVLDIGGQDTKAIQLGEKGVVRSFFMNDRCAAGCGRYLGYVAEELALGLPELGATACSACRYIPITSTCTVFAGAELRSLLYAGEKKEEILLGLHRAIVLRAMSLLARSGGVFNEFTFTGGVANNEAVVMLLKELVAKNYSEITLNIHPDSIYMGALGAAFFARELL